MEPIEYSRLASFEDSYWWHRGRNRIVATQLEKLLGEKRGADILNVGCGTGGSVRMLERHGSVWNVDVAEPAVHACRSRGIRNVMKVNSLRLPFPDESFDLVAALDVLEHIEEDGAALREWQRVLRPGGKVLITAPAYQWLWSEHDESLHHFRRYTAAGLHQLLNRHGFRTLKRTYAISICFPLIVGYRLLRSLSSKKRSTSYVRVPRWINSLLAGILSLEGYLLSRRNIPFGTSVLMIGEKDCSAIGAYEYATHHEASDPFAVPVAVHRAITPPHI